MGAGPVPNINPVGVLHPSFRDWPSVTTLLNAFIGDHDKVWFVGGCVRDALRDNNAAIGTDIDLATALSPDRVQERLAAAGISVALYGLAHGTVTALINGHGFEITTLRNDVETFGRRASVSFVDVDWFDDAGRRDFTFNALYLTPDGTLYDPFDGRQDLAAGRVRFIGNSTQRITEDFLRILRFYRFYALIGRGPLDADAASACALLAPRVAGLSAERVRGELFKLILAPNPIPALFGMLDVGLFLNLFPDGAPTKTTVMALESALNRCPTLSLGARCLILWGGQDTAHGALDRLKAPKTLKSDIDTLTAMISGPQTPFEVYYRRGAITLQDVLCLRTDPNAAAIYQDLTQHSVPIFPLKGQDLLDANIAAGPELGNLLRQAEAFWINQKGNATLNDCLQFLKQPNPS